MMNIGTKVLKKTSLIRNHYYWPNCESDVRNHISNCERCVLSNPLNIKTPLGPLMASRPMEVVALDYTVLDKASNGLENALVITDIFSKWVDVVATKDQKASTVARVLVREWFSRFGPPLRIHSDRGRDFESKVVRSLCKMYGTSKSRICSYRPQGNGQCERYNQTLHDLLRSLPSDKKKKWPMYLQGITYAYNTTPHRSTGYFTCFMEGNPD